MARFSLVPRDARFNTLLEQAAATTHTAAQTLHGMLVGYPAQRVHACKDATELLRQGIREAFAAMWDEAAVVICWKDIYTRFEKAVDASEDAATVLEQIGVKHA